MTPPNLTSRSIAVALACIVTALCANSPVAAQLSVTPPRLVLTASDRSGEVEVKNPTSKSVVVNARLMHAVMRTDSTGRSYRDTVRTKAADERSALDWVRVFPRQFTLGPNESRLVKVLASPPGGLADGEWSARLDIVGLAVERPKSLEVDTTKISANLNYSYAYNIPVLYRSGKLETGLVFDPVRAEYSTEGASVFMKLLPTGNSAYRGSFYATVFNASGSADTTLEMPIVAEVPYEYPLALPRLKPGTYRIKLTAATRRRGTINDILVQAEPVTREFEVTFREKDISVASK